MMHTIPHMVRMCGSGVTERILVRDDAPLRGEWQSRPSVGTPEELRACCDELLERGIVDAVVPVDSSRVYRHRTYSQHLGFPFHDSHSRRGTPVLGYIAGLDVGAADYVVHFDSDMFLHQAAGHSWIKEGIDLLQAHPDVMAVLPRSGPPAQDGRLLQQESIGEGFVRDPAGFFRFKTFTSRVFLIDRRRFDQLLPLRTGLSVWSQLLDGLGWRPGLPEWETMVAGRLEETDFFRVDLESPRAWTLHPTVRGAAFEAVLPEIIRRIEAGEYPAAQGGHYDIELEEWVREIDQGRLSP